MNTKKEYISPELKVVEFKVEKGFAQSLNQSTRNPDNLTWDDRTRVNLNPFGVSLSGNNDDWD